MQDDLAGEIRSREFSRDAKVLRSGARDNPNIRRPKAPLALATPPHSIGTTESSHAKLVSPRDLHSG
jgi:hypothetical protein